MMLCDVCKVARCIQAGAAGAGAGADICVECHPSWELSLGWRGAKYVSRPAALILTPG